MVSKHTLGIRSFNDVSHRILFSHILWFLGCGNMRLPKQRTSCLARYTLLLATERANQRYDPKHRYPHTWLRCWKPSDCWTGFPVVELRNVRMISRLVDALLGLASCGLSCARISLSLDDSWSFKEALRRLGFADFKRLLAPFWVFELTAAVPCVTQRRGASCQSLLNAFQPVSSFRIFAVQRDNVRLQYRQRAPAWKW